jgi:hypothetical protein
MPESTEVGAVVPLSGLRIVMLAITSQMTLLHGEQEARLTEARARFNPPLVGVSVSLPGGSSTGDSGLESLRHDGTTFLRLVFHTLTTELPSVSPSGLLTISSLETQKGCEVMCDNS